MKEIQFSKIENLVSRQNQHIDLFAEDTIPQIEEYLEEELAELREALKNGSFNKVEVESEIGDLMYLLIRLSQLTGIDLIEAVLAKITRNFRKYYKQESRETAKKLWGGKDNEFLSEWTEKFREKQVKKLLD